MRATYRICISRQDYTCLEGSVSTQTCGVHSTRMRDVFMAYAFRFTWARAPSEIGRAIYSVPPTTHIARSRLQSGCIIDSRVNSRGFKAIYTFFYNIVGVISRTNESRGSFRLYSTRARRPTTYFSNAKWELEKCVCVFFALDHAQSLRLHIMSRLCARWAREVNTLYVFDTII